MEDIVENIFKKPKRDKGDSMPHYQTYPLNYKHQCDLLYLPHDGQYKYALVVVDVGTRLMDAEPLKNKTPQHVADALEDIYNRDILSHPQKLYFDAGTEFKGRFLKYLEENNISHRASKPYRHRQTALAEYKNKIIGKVLFKRMIQEEILIGEISTQWVNYLPTVVKDINTKIKNKKVVKQEDTFPCQGDSCNLLEQGTKVRVALDAPREFLTGKRLTGNFRETDIRYDLTPRTITSTLIKARQPPLYILDNDNSIAYTKNQLQVIPKNEQKPSSDKIQPVKGKNVYLVDKIIDKKKEHGRIYYYVKWLGYDDSYNTWELGTKLKKDVPNLVKEYEKSIKSKA